MIMKERTKYMLMGMIIGIIIGMVLLYTLVTFRIVRPFGFREFAGAGNGNFTSNFTNMTMPFRNR